MRKRSEAEQKAREAREKAEAMRRQAFQAASRSARTRDVRLRRSLARKRPSASVRCNASWKKSSETRSSLTSGRKRPPRRQRRLAVVLRSCA